LITSVSKTGKSSGFNRVALERLPIKVPDAFVLAFEVDTTTPVDFERYGIRCPPSIQRSVPKRQAEYLAGRRVALAALRAQGADALDVDIGQARAPAWPQGFTGSITHTTGIAAAVAMPAESVRGIGIDIEYIATAETLKAIRETAVNIEECARLDSIAATFGWPFALTLAFSTKESFYKATSATVGRMFDFTALRIVDGASGEGVLEVELAETLAPSLPAGMRFVVSYERMDERSVITSFVW